MKDLMKIDLYELLNIKVTAEESEIRTAYRKKALFCHPDKNPDNPKAAELFKQISKAVQILTDKSSRADYDKILQERKRRKAAFKQHLKKCAERNQRNDIYCRKKTPPPEPRFRTEEEKLRLGFHAFFEDLIRRKYCPPNRKTASPSQKKEKHRTFPSWPPSGSGSPSATEKKFYFRKCFSENLKREEKNLHKNCSTPTWPPSASKTEAESASGMQKNEKPCYFEGCKPILRPATFVLPTINLNFPDFSKDRKPILKPATFIAPSVNRSSSDSSRGPSPILKKATFVAP